MPSLADDANRFSFYNLETSCPIYEFDTPHLPTLVLFMVQNVFHVSQEVPVSNITFSTITYLCNFS